MKIKHMRYFIIIIILTGLVVAKIGYDKFKYVPFRIVCVKDDKFLVVDEKINKQLYANIIFVLKYYDVDFVEDESDGICIHNFIWQDENLMWNFSNKAKDQEWLEMHRKNSD